MNYVAPNGEPLLAEIQKSRGGLRPVEERLASLIVRAPHSVPQMSLSALAGKAGVSEPTIIRFCRKFGCTGFTDFKLKLAQELAASKPYVHQEINFDDDVVEVAGKIFNSCIVAFDRLNKVLDRKLLEQAVDILARARRIEIFASGHSSASAIDTQHTLMMLEAPAVFQFDAKLQRMSALVLSYLDVALCLSPSGQSEHVVDCARAALEAGATVVSITRSNTSLSRVSSLVIPVDTIESTYLYSQNATRLAHLAIVDILAMGIALRRGSGMRLRIERMKEAVRDLPEDNAGEPSDLLRSNNWPVAAES